MNITRATTTGTMLLALAISAVPAFAAAGDQSGRERRQERVARVQPNSGGSAPRAQANNDRANGRQARGASQAEARRDVAVQRVAPRVDSGAQTAARQTAPRQYDTRQTAPRQTDVRQTAPRQTDVRPTAPRQYDTRQTTPRQYDTRQTAPRQYDTRQTAPRQYDTRQTAPRQYGTRQAVPRQYDTRQYTSRQYDTRRYNNRAYLGGGYGGYGGYGYRAYIPRPRVRFGLGISIFAGSPYGFRFDYGWAPSYAYRFPMRQGIGYGGMSFLIDPDDAAVYVDQQFIGIARDFDGQPVPLAAGMHEIELQAEGCEPVVFDISVRPGQVIPYRGSLVPYR